jgi:hypothetical protein
MLFEIHNPPTEAFDERSSHIEAWTDPQKRIIVLKSVDNVPGEGQLLHVTITGATRAQCANILLKLFPGHLWESDWRKQPYDFWSKLIKEVISHSAISN